MNKTLISALLLSSFSVFAVEVKVPATEIEFSVSKDVEVSKASLGIRCLRKATFFERFNNGLKDYMKCNDFTVNGEEPGFATPHVALKKIGKNKFSLDKELKVKFSQDRHGHVCLIVEAKFDKNVEFQEYNDTFSLLSYCNVDELPFKINEYVYNNRRASSFDEFMDSLGRPIDVILK